MPFCYLNSKLLHLSMEHYTYNSFLQVSIEAVAVAIEAALLLQ
jgi:hypothetical protein